MKIFQSVIIILIVVLLSVQTSYLYAKEADTLSDSQIREIDKNIELLGHKDPKIRETAKRKLAKMGRLVVSELIKTKKYVKNVKTNYELYAKSDLHLFFHYFDSPQ